MSMSTLPKPLHNPASPETTLTTTKKLDLHVGPNVGALLIRIGFFEGRGLPSTIIE